ncbi:MAG: excinuclease ABC subunit B [Candidatus Margulisbacteria bacterium GWF2_35_9]|nr:MAG: excinuclease ABC subunit B [Candidatus Margulisbacteria bacterium GWF2_35_9]
MSEFILESPYQPTGDQPQAIKKLVDGVKNGERFQTLFGVTGSGKTYTLANVIAQVNKPVLIMAHNKTLAAQLTSEYKDFFPKNAVEFFISFYDYYQPEAYMPTTDTYIEKDSAINDEIDRLRHRATYSLFNRNDVVIVASVSCIYGLGSPENYLEGSCLIKTGETLIRDSFLEQLLEIRYERNDVNLTRGKFRVIGECIEIYPAYDEYILRIAFFGDEVEKITYIDPINRNKIKEFDQFILYPASHYVVPSMSMDDIVVTIRTELDSRLKELKENGKLLEAQRLEQRTMFDLEMMKEVGYCTGIENYSRHLTKRKPGDPPYTLMDYFPKDYLVIIDESHVSLPQVRGMYAGDQSRKKTLVDYGFRLPSALDNRPLNFSEFEDKIPQIIFVSATPGPYETEHATVVAEQVIRPTGLIDPRIEVRKTENQMDNLMAEIKKRVENKERTLVVTITKKMAEDLTTYLLNKQIKTRYLHSDIDTMERFEILHGLRSGSFDVLVGINLLREGLDLPEVSLIAILDADKEGFLRDERSLIQIIGRAARNVNGTVLLYADKMTGSMSRAINETNRRRKIQMQYNTDHNITPATIISRIKYNIREEGSATNEKSGKNAVKDLQWLSKINKESLSPKELLSTISVLRKEMREAAKSLDFEKAALIRDKLFSLE